MLQKQKLQNRMKSSKILGEAKSIMVRWVGKRVEKHHWLSGADP